MRNTHRTFPLLLITVLAISSLSLTMLTVKPASAQSISTPPAPQFTVNYLDLSHDVAPTTTTDPFTGKQTTNNNGYHVDNRTLVFTIKNQPFTPYKDSSGNEISKYYNFRVKGHFGDQWYYYPYGLNGASTWLYGRFDSGGLPSFEFPASSSDYTTAFISLYSFFNTQIPPDDSQLDVQVQALVGQVNIVNTGLIAGDGYNFTGESSDWSNIRTINLADGSVSISPSSNPTVTPSSTPAVPELSWLAVIPLFAAMLFIAVALRHRKSQVKKV